VASPALVGHMDELFIAFFVEDSGRGNHIGDELFRHWQTYFWATSDVSYETSRDEIKERAADAKCVLVLWSTAGNQEKWLHEVAEIAKKRGVLVQATLGVFLPPTPFRDVESVSLTNWRGSEREPEFLSLTSSISRHVRPSKEPLVSEARPRRIFLCYRREDTQGEAGRLHDRLSAVYGPEWVFMDVDSVPFGVDFVDHIREQLADCAVMIVVIGRSWASTTDRKGRRRLEEREDWVRVEIAEALKRKLPILPVLVQNATMPDAEDLPEDIRVFARRNAIDMTHRRWQADVEQLLQAINRFMPDDPSPTS
jgi:hypothetical protein